VNLRGPINCPSRWQPVNRRRFLNSGWHLDVREGRMSNGLVVRL
jgi:hypothetical protein